MTCKERIFLTTNSCRICEHGNISEECVNFVVWYECWRKCSKWWICWRQLWTILYRLEDGIITRQHNSHNDTCRPTVGANFWSYRSCCWAGLYTFWISPHRHYKKLHVQKIAIGMLLDGYYSFEQHHMQPALYLLLMGWSVRKCPLLYGWDVV